MTVEMWVCELCSLLKQQRAGGSAAMGHSLGGCRVAGAVSAQTRDRLGLLLLKFCRLHVSSSGCGQGTGVVLEPAHGLQGRYKSTAQRWHLNASLSVLS